MSARYRLLVANPKKLARSACHLPMMTRTRSALTLSITLAATLVLAACGGGGSTSIPDIPDMPDAGNLQEAGQQISAAAAECSAGSQKMSEELQVLTQAIRDKDLEAAKATAPVFEEAAAQMASSVEADSEDAFDELSKASDALTDKITEASGELSSSLGG